MWLQDNIVTGVTTKSTPGEVVQCGRRSAEWGMETGKCGTRTAELGEQPSNRNPQPSGVVRRPQIRKLGEQVAVGPYLIPRHLSICKDSQEGILDVVGECPAIVREGRRARGVKVMPTYFGRKSCLAEPSRFLL